MPGRQTKQTVQKKTTRRTKKEDSNENENENSDETTETRTEDQTEIVNAEPINISEALADTINVPEVKETWADQIKESSEILSSPNIEIKNASVQLIPAIPSIQLSTPVVETVVVEKKSIADFDRADIIKLDNERTKDMSVINLLKILIVRGENEDNPNPALKMGTVKLLRQLNCEVLRAKDVKPDELENSVGENSNGENENNNRRNGQNRQQENKYFKQKNNDSRFGRQNNYNSVNRDVQDTENSNPDFRQNRQVNNLNREPRENNVRENVQREPREPREPRENVSREQREPREPRQDFRDFRDNRDQNPRFQRTNGFNNNNGRSFNMNVGTNRFGADKKQDVQSRSPVQSSQSP